MRIVTANEIWKGFFSYEEGYTEISTFKEVKFEIDIVVKNNSFVGKAKDEESEKYFDTPTTVKGFFENNIISFIMKYPYTYYRDDNDNIIVDKTLEHPDINYYGEYDENTKSYKGKWEITYLVEQLLDGDIEEVYSGQWELRKFRGI